mmetsp:Transcript_131427/g.356873  ORF Transcript_131427/g.356873 Transcript_131427/m.356873 type:complete len:264 (+) Transcript_131427:451-1242(+)
MHLWRETPRDEARMQKAHHVLRELPHQEALQADEGAQHDGQLVLSSWQVRIAEDLLAEYVDRQRIGLIWPTLADVHKIGDAHHLVGIRAGRVRPDDVLPRPLAHGDEHVEAGEVVGHGEVRGGNRRPAVRGRLERCALGAPIGWRRARGGAVQHVGAVHLLADVLEQVLREGRPPNALLDVGVVKGHPQQRRGPHQGQVGGRHALRPRALVRRRAGDAVGPARPHGRQDRRPALRPPGPTYGRGAVPLGQRVQVVARRARWCC